MKRVYIGLLSVMMLAGMCTGCAQQSGDSVASSPASVAVQEAASEPQAEEAEEAYQYFNEAYPSGFVYNTSDILDYKKRQQSSRELWRRWSMRRRRMQ